MTDLLKSKAKIQAVVKDRVKYEPLAFEQRVRDGKEELRNVLNKRPVPKSALDSSKWGVKNKAPKDN